VEGSAPVPYIFGFIKRVNGFTGTIVLKIFLRDEKE
jgi:hypothetical protein